MAGRGPPDEPLEGRTHFIETAEPVPGSQWFDRLALLFYPSHWFDQLQFSFHPNADPPTYALVDERGRPTVRQMPGRR